MDTDEKQRLTRIARIFANWSQAVFIRDNSRNSRRVRFLKIWTPRRFHGDKSPAENSENSPHSISLIG
jgi:hypothetical protein